MPYSCERSVAISSLRAASGARVFATTGQLPARMRFLCSRERGAVRGVDANPHAAEELSRLRQSVADAPGVVPSLVVRRAASLK